MKTTNEKTVSGLGISTALKRPDWICSKVRQEVIVMRDASPSMNEKDKAKQAVAACNEMMDALAQPINKSGFYATVIDFNNTALPVHDWAPVSDLAGRIGPLEIGNTTNITAALELGVRQLTAHKRDETFQWLKPVGLLFSDGCHNADGTPPEELADRFKELADLVTVAFGDDADEDLLRRLATSPQHFYRVTNGAELRNFMAKAGETLTIGMVQKKDSTIPLAHLNG